MATAIVSIAVASLRDLLKEEAKFLSGVTDQVQEISRELRRMQCFLQDADTRDYKDEIVRNWLKEIRSLTYRVEDVVEKFAVEVAFKRGEGVKKVLTRFACIFCEGRSLHNIGLKIAKIQTDIIQLTTSLERYDIKANISDGESSGAANENQRWARQTYAHEVEEYFVGMEEDIKKLVSLMIDDQRHQPITSIWGMGGLGKTTIARKIYKHIDVQRCFDRFAWVCITQQGQIKGILQDILIQVLPDKKEEVKHMENSELVRELYQVQRENKCIVVLDDIWHMRDWEKLVHAFPVAEGASKILLTTRTKEVAEIGHLHELKYLNDRESWELLKNIAFSKKNVEVLKVEPKLQAIGIEMVQKCGGLPLAITVLGGILKNKDTLREWQVVNKNIDSYLSKGKGTEEGSDGGTVAQILSLSYNVLPYHLKPCFLYLGNFWEDERVNAEELYLLWIAEGMVLSQHKRSGETLREVAERYLNELGQRSMVQLQVNDLSIYRRFRSCRLHDMMRDFCLKKGREEDFFGVIDLRGVNNPSLDSFSPIDSAAYRLVIHTSGEVEAPINAATVLENYKQLRSLLFRHVWVSETKNLWPQWMDNYENLESLRVLKFEEFNFEGQKLPRGLEKLIHLRLLSFNGSHFDDGISPLPSSVFNLPFLQTLDLRIIAEEIKIPNVLVKMKRLRHLYLPSRLRSEKAQEKLRLRGLSELETLVGFESSKLEIANLNELFNFRILNATVIDNENLCDIVKYLMSKNGQNLQETRLAIKDAVSFSSEEGSILLRKILACGNLHILMIDRVKISKFPPYRELFLQSLVSLWLFQTEIDEDPMETLEKLPELRSLGLSFNSYIRKDLICHEFGFLQLRDLALINLPNSCCLRVDKGGMPNFSHLMINTCPVLGKIPDGLKYAAGLQDLIIRSMPATFAERMKVVDGREGEDFDKIRHVPSITFYGCDLNRSRYSHFYGCD